jgi:GT2 family glycosyltransferase
VSRAAWLSETVLLVACEEEAAMPLEGEAQVFAAPGGRILAAPAGESLAAEVEESVTDLATFLREGPAGWDAPLRARLLRFFASLAADHPPSASMSEGLRQAREALREHRPLSIEDRRLGLGIDVDRLHRIDERTFYVRGRAWTEDGPLVSLTAISPEGERVELQDLACRHPGGEGGFAATFATAAPSRGEEGWVLEAAAVPERAVEAAASLAPDPLRTLYADAALEHPEAEQLRRRHLHPAIARLGELRRAGTRIVELAEHGRAPSLPAASLVIPLQRRVELIEHQIAQFAADPEVAECELLYVLDEPEQADLLAELGAELFGLYGLPVRLTVLDREAGLATACNLGASLARAGRLVFLAADVLPDRPGWLGFMGSGLEADAVAAVTPKLLCADEAIDQAGLEYAVTARDGCLVRPRLRGMHRRVAAAEEGGAVPAASLACLMVDADAFAALGGFSGEYDLGEYEGSDLAQRIAERGMEVHYAPAAELYRLEGLGAGPEPLGEPFARWLHARTWGEAIA